MRTVLFTFFLMALLPVALCAQMEHTDTDAPQATPQKRTSDTSTPAAEQSAPQGTAEQENDGKSAFSVSVPSAITGTGSNSVSRIGTPMSGYISGGLGVSMVYDDNPLNLHDNHLHDTTYSIAPEFGLRQNGSWGSWDVDYSGGVTFGRQLDSRNEMLQRLATNVRYHLTRHVELNLRQSFSLTSTPLAGVVGATGGTLELNQFAVTPSASRNSLEFAGDVGWHFGPHSVVGFTSSYSRLRFSHIQGTQSLFPSDEVSFGAYFGRQLSRRQSIGVAAQFQDLSTPDIVGQEARTQGVQAFDVFQINREFSVSLYGGPQHRHIRSLSAAATDNRVNFAGGAQLMWQKQHLSVALTYDDSTRDGGGVVQVVRLKSGIASVTAKLSPTWAFGVTCGVGDNQVLLGSPALDSFRTMSGTFSIEHRLLSNIELKAQYEHVRQLHGAASAVTQAIDRNRIQFEVAYRFTRPLRKGENGR